MKSIRCRDVGVDCDFEAQAETEDEVLRMCAEHARTEHGMMEVPPELAEKVRMNIRDVTPARA